MLKLFSWHELGVPKKKGLVLKKIKNTKLKTSMIGIQTIHVIYVRMSTHIRGSTGLKF